MKPTRLVPAAFCIGLILSFSGTALSRTKSNSPVQLQAIQLSKAGDLGPLIERASLAKVVLLGEATHGTSEFYSWRTEITLRLIQEHGFSFIAVEGDWASCAAVNQYVKGRPGSDESATDVLKNNFNRWPTWMWANGDVVDLVTRLKSINSERNPDERVGFYGMDVYDYQTSVLRVREYAGRSMPDSLAAIEGAYACLDTYGGDIWTYAHMVSRGAETCVDAVGSVVKLLEANADTLTAADSQSYFDALQNAHVVRNAERHHRESVHGGPHGWNTRVVHMTHTVQRLLDKHGANAKAIVWAHNTHVGDARATSMARHGQINIGQLKRESLGRERVYSVGFGTSEGLVLAGTRWGSSMHIMKIPPPQNGTYEQILSSVPMESFYFFLDKDLRAEKRFKGPMGHRAIGVVYDPENESGNYVPTRLPERYDAFIFIRKTNPLRPL